ncbi:MAG: glycosyltransferase [Pseudomonadota bacterium]
MKLSVILVSYDMAREIPRTLEGLARVYQEGAETLEYEVLLIDNGSPTPLDAAIWKGIDVPVRLIEVENASASPARAINIGLQEAKGQVVCLMVDAAHLLTPGAFRLPLSCFEAFAEPVVALRYFYLGPDEQTVSVANGYDKAAEDALLEKIAWPSAGYRLYEICTPLRSGAKIVNWLNRIFESNCLFMSRAHFCDIGGADERFDLPGGGFVNLDIYKRAVEAPDVTAVQLIGEGSFHQLHGGVTTNSLAPERKVTLEKFREQYRAIRGHDDLMADTEMFYFGHVPTMQANITALQRARLRNAGKLVD